MVRPAGRIRLDADRVVTDAVNGVFGFRRLRLANERLRNACTTGGMSYRPFGEKKAHEQTNVVRFR